MAYYKSINPCGMIYTTRSKQNWIRLWVSEPWKYILEGLKKLISIGNVCFSFQAFVRLFFE